MINPTLFIRTRRSLLRALPLLAGLVLLSCLLDKRKDEVDLTLSKVPDKTDWIQVFAVDRNDTGKVLAKLDEENWAPGKVLHFSVDAVKGQDWTLKVMGFQSDYLIYLSIIPPGNTGADTAQHIDVQGNWPTVFFTGVSRDGDSVRFVTAFRSADTDHLWHLFARSDSDAKVNYFPVATTKFALAASALNPDSLLIADLHEPDSGRVPVQFADTMLGGEALAPAGSSVRITDALRDGDSVRISITLKNFQSPLVDNPTPGQGSAKVHDLKGMRDLNFHTEGGDMTHLVGPVSELAGVDKIVVALHYSNGMRVRPAAADTLEAATALRTLPPSLHIVSHLLIGDTLRLVLDRKNFTGLHCHIYKDLLVWPGSTSYQICSEDTCYVRSQIWQGARALIVVAHKSDTHDLLRPIVQDSLLSPFSP